MQYLLFDVEDFCKDAYFISWVNSPTEESNLFWKSFLEAHPHKAEEIQLALEFIRTIRFSEIEPSNQDLLRLKQRIWTDIEKPQPKIDLWTPIRYGVAASVVFLLLVGLWFYQKAGEAPMTYSTTYGQIREINLADGSVVTLNARSELRVIENISEREVREVWLTGEAYFKIVKSQKIKFIVHTPETQVEVLGTEFNVNTRRKQTQVVLAEGSVQLISGGNNQDIVMKPGDLAIVSSNSQVKLKTVQPHHYDSWKESIILMDDKPVAEVVELIEDTYGVKLHFADSSLLSRKLSGKLLLKNPEHILDNLSTILATELEKTQGGYLFR